MLPIAPVNSVVADSVDLMVYCLLQDVTDVGSTQVEHNDLAGAIDDAWRVRYVHRFVSVEHRLVDTSLVGIVRVDLAGRTKFVDDSLSCAVATVVTIKSPGIELVVGGQIQPHRSTMEIVEVDAVTAAVVAASRIGTGSNTDVLFGLLHCHSFGAEA